MSRCYDICRPEGYGGPMDLVPTALVLGARLRAERHAQGLTQAQLAERAHVSRAFVIDLEQGRRAGAELARVLAVVRALGLVLAIGEDRRKTFDEALEDLLNGKP